MSAGYVTADLDAVPTLRSDDPADPGWKPVRHHLGIGAFGVNAWVAGGPGDVVIERHDEVPGDDDPAAVGHEELYVVVRGSARFTVAGEEIEAPPGTLVFVSDRTLTREAIATAPDTLVLAVGAAPGVAFAPSPWEERSLRKEDGA